MEKRDSDREKLKLKDFDPTNVEYEEDPEDIIRNDRDADRRNTFKEALKRIKLIIPEYFLSEKRKRKNSSSGGTSFAQNIVVTKDVAKLETKDVSEAKENKEDKAKGMERDD